MITITNTLTFFTWYGPDLLLTEYFPWKEYVGGLYLVGPTGASFVSYKPTTRFPAFNVVRTGDRLLLSAINVPPDGFLLDNGEPPTVTPRPAPSEVELYVTEANALVCDMQQFTEPYRFSLARLGQQDPAVAVVVSINQGDYLSLDAANSLVANLTDLEVADGIQVQFRVTRPTTAPASIFITFSY